MASQIKQAIPKTRGPDPRGWGAGQPARGQCTRIVFVAAILFIDLNACAVFAQIPLPRTVPDPNVKLSQILLALHLPRLRRPLRTRRGTFHRSRPCLKDLVGIRCGCRRSATRHCPWGKPPVPNAETLQKYGQYVDKVIDPENTFDAIVGRPRVMILKQIPTRFQLEEERVARAIPFFENKQLSITGLHVGDHHPQFMVRRPEGPRWPDGLELSGPSSFPTPRPDSASSGVRRAGASRSTSSSPNSVVRLSLAGDKLVVSGQAKDIVDAYNILRVVRANAPGGAGGAVGEAVVELRGALADPTRPAGDDDGDQSETGGLMAVTTPASVDPLTGASIGSQVGTLPTLDNYVLAGGPNVIDLLRVPGEQQIMLRVTVAEIDRTAARTIGMNFDILNKKGVPVFASVLTGLSGTPTAHVFGLREYGRHPG